MFKKLAAFFRAKNPAEGLYTPTKINLANSPPTPRSYYKLWAIRCQVNGVERYRRPNYNGSIWFEGTELNVRVIPDFSHAQLSTEGLYNFADVGEALNVVYAEQEIMDMKVNLPVLVINSNTGGYHLVEANIEKVADSDKGGSAQLKQEIARYAERHLKVTFVD